MRRLLFIVAVACAAQETAPIRAGVQEVTISVSVTDKNGAPVNGLLRGDFTILDNGQTRPVQSFWRETDLPLTIGFIADLSGSQRGEIKKHREAITQFFNRVMGPRDQAFVVTVSNNKVRLAADLTSSIDTLRASVANASNGKDAPPFGESCAGQSGTFGIILCETPLWDGIYSAASLKLKSVAGRKALIVLSDGRNLGSRHSLTDAIEAAQAAGTAVYTIFYLGQVSKFNPFTGLKARGRDEFSRLAAETGGASFDSPNDPTSVLAQIADQLRNLYVLGFTPPEDVLDGSVHKLEIHTSRAATIRARPGYTGARVAQ